MLRIRSLGRLGRQVTLLEVRCDPDQTLVVSNFNPLIAGKVSTSLDMIMQMLGLFTRQELRGHQQRCNPVE